MGKAKKDENWILLEAANVAPKDKLVRVVSNDKFRSCVACAEKLLDGEISRDDLVMLYSSLHVLQLQSHTYIQTRSFADKPVRIRPVGAG